MVAGEPGKSVEFLDLPSAREILAGTGPPPELRPATPATPPSRPDHVVLLPTYAEEPGHWSPPLWFAWPPAALMVLLLGAAGAWLSWCWARESYNASVVARRLLSAAPTPSKVRPLPEYVVPPAASWWQTTPLHLAQWGVYLGRVGGEEGDRTDEARELIDGAVRISPLHPMARLARAQLEQEGAQPRAEVAELGMSRDAISLAWSARQQRLAGKKEIALRLYRQALRLADEGEDPRAASPAFSEEPGARRYLLPGEAVVGPIVNDLASDPRWTFEEWSAALPSGSVAELAAARILNAQGRPEAERLVKQIVERAGAAPASAHERALRLAVEAEALALRSRWAKSAQCYREAIDLIEDSKVQRSWWFNLADIAVHLDDEAQRQAALEAAGEASPADDISRRAADLQRLPETRNRLRPGGTKAN